MARILEACWKDGLDPGQFDFVIATSVVASAMLPLRRPQFKQQRTASVPWQMCKLRSRHH